MDGSDASQDTYEDENDEYDPANAVASKTNSVSNDNSSDYEIDSSRDASLSSSRQNNRRRQRDEEDQGADDENDEMDSEEEEEPNSNSQILTPKTKRNSINGGDDGVLDITDNSPITTSTTQTQPYSANLSKINDGNLGGLPKPDSMVLPKGMPRYDPNDFDSGDDDDDYDMDAKDDEVDQAQSYNSKSPSSEQSPADEEESDDDIEHTSLNDVTSEEGSITLKDGSNDYDNDNYGGNTALDTGDRARPSSTRDNAAADRGFNSRNPGARKRNDRPKSSQNFSAESTISSKPSTYNLRDRQWNPDDFDSNEFDYKSEEWDSGTDDDNDSSDNARNRSRSVSSERDKGRTKGAMPQAKSNDRQHRSSPVDSDASDEDLSLEDNMDSYTEPLNDESDEFHGGESSTSLLKYHDSGGRKKNLQNSFATASENSGVGLSIATYSPNTAAEGTVSIDPQSPGTLALSIDTFTDSPKKAPLSDYNENDSGRNGERVRPQRTPKRGGGFHPRRGTPSTQKDDTDDGDDMRPLNVEDFDSDDDDEEEEEEEVEGDSSESRQDESVQSFAGDEGSGLVNDDDDDMPEDEDESEGSMSDVEEKEGEEEEDSNGEGDSASGEGGGETDDDYWDENNYMRGVYPNEEDEYDDSDDPMLYQQTSAPRYDYNDSDSDPLEVEGDDDDSDYDDDVEDDREYYDDDEGDDGEYQDDDSQDQSSGSEWSSEDYSGSSSGYYEPGLSTVAEESPSQLDFMMSDDSINMPGGSEYFFNKPDYSGTKKSIKPQSDQSFGWESLPPSSRKISNKNNMREESLDLFGGSAKKTSKNNMSEESLDLFGDSPVPESDAPKSPTQRSRLSPGTNPLGVFEEEEEEEEEETEVDNIGLEHGSKIGSQLDFGDLPTPPTSEQFRKMKEEQEREQAGLDSDDSSNYIINHWPGNSDDRFDDDDGGDNDDDRPLTKKEAQMKRLHLCLTVVCCLFLIFDVILFLIWVARNYGIDRGNDDPVDDFLNPTRIAATVPQTICLEYIPGVPLTEGCGGNSALSRYRSLHEASDIRNLETAGAVSGTVGDILALAIWNVTQADDYRLSRPADLALIHGGMAETDIAEGSFSVQSAMDLLVGRFDTDPLVVLEVTGQQLKQVLEEAMDFALGFEKADFSSSYPYGAGIRFTVSKDASKFTRVVNIEILHRTASSRSRQRSLLRGQPVDRKSRHLTDIHNGIWLPLELEQKYSVITTQQLAQGGVGYLEFADVIDEAVWLETTTLQAVVRYADYEEVLEAPVAGSTREFL